MATMPDGSYVADTQSGQALPGQPDRDFIFGSRGHDAVVARPGSEITGTTEDSGQSFGGTGNDAMIDGPGSFDFDSQGGTDVVMDFHAGDIIQIQRNIHNLQITSPADLIAHVSDRHGNAVITLGSETITLIGVKAEDIHNNPSGYFTIH